jgi:hypothetical protein
MPPAIMSVSGALGENPELFEHTQLPDNYWEALLAWRPPMPVDYPSIMDLEIEAVGYIPQTPGYSLVERLPRYQAAMEALFKLPSPIPRVALDLYCSVPLYPQANRGIELKRCAEGADELMSSLFKIMPVRGPQKESHGHRSKESREHTLEDAWFNHLHYAAARSEEARDLLHATIHHVLYTLNSYDMAGGNQREATRRLQARFMALFGAQIATYAFSETGDDIESRWQIKFHSQQQHATYQERIAYLPCRSPGAIRAGQRMEGHGYNPQDAELAKEKVYPGEVLAEKYIEWQAHTLARLIAESGGHYQITRFASMDWADPREIALSSIKNLPRSIQNMNMFPHAIRSLFEPHHIVQDLSKKLEVPDNSITLITAFDGWPFNTSLGGLTDQEVDDYCNEGANRIFGWYKKLTYGGKLVIFPWTIRGEDPRVRSVLDSIESQLSLRLGHGVRSDRFHPATLKEPMSVFERAIAENLSGIFNGGQDVRTLIVEKPNRKFVDAHMQAYGKRMLIAAQDQDSADPTP